MSDSPSTFFAAATTAVAERGKACLDAVIAEVNNAENIGETPAFCDLTEIKGIDGLRGVYTITMQISTDGASVKTEHRHEE